MIKYIIFNINNYYSILYKKVKQKDNFHGLIENIDANISTIQFLKNSLYNQLMN